MNVPEDKVLGKLKEGLGFKEDYLTLLEELDSSDEDKVKEFKDLIYDFYDGEEEPEKKDEEQSDLDLLLKSV